MTKPEFHKKMYRSFRSNGMSVKDALWKLCNLIKHERVGLHGVSSREVIEGNIRAWCDPSKYVQMWNSYPTDIELHQEAWTKQQNPNWYNVLAYEMGMTEYLEARFMHVTGEYWPNDWAEHWPQLEIPIKLDGIEKAGKPIIDFIPKKHNSDERS